jgi:hypothetical protein
MVDVDVVVELERRLRPIAMDESIARQRGKLCPIEHKVSTRPVVKV